MEPTEQPVSLEAYFSFAGPINQDAARAFFTRFSHASQHGVKRAHLLLQSTGGSVADGIAIYNFLRALPFELITYNAGQVASVAVLIALAGRVRIASKLATFVIHKSSFGVQVPLTVNDLRVVTENVKRNDAITEAVLHEHLMMPRHKWRAHAKRDLVITAQEAIKFALVHEVREYHVPEGYSCIFIA